MSTSRFHPDQPLKCLLISPSFPEGAFWNWKEVCEVLGKRAMGIPLGIITFAATLPSHWDMKLVDLNTTDLSEEAWEWADLVCVGGMIVQQDGTLEVIQRARQEGKFVVVGGADPTSQPTLYKNADALVLGEAESIVPIWLESWRRGSPSGKFQADKKPDITQSPVPRYDLLDFRNYMQIAVQFSRGCPFNCEFCDIIELYGRNPRAKTPEQFLEELETLYNLGYRGSIDVVDDNFVGNKKKMKKMLSALKAWSEKHDYPFSYTTQASLNLADDAHLMSTMRDLDFVSIFLGIETPDPKLLETTQKRQNLYKPIVDRIRRIYDHGMSVTAGFILGFDGESRGAGDLIIECVEENAIPLAMVSLLTALPNTQLSKRLAREGRLLDSRTDKLLEPGQRHEVVVQTAKGGAVDRTVFWGLKFTTTRDRYEILQEHNHVWQTIYEPKHYFKRVLRSAKMINKAEIGRKSELTRRRQRRERLRGFVKIVLQLTRIPSLRWTVWRTLVRAIFLGRYRFEHVATMAVVYYHMHNVQQRIEEGLPKRIHLERGQEIPKVCYHTDDTPRSLTAAA